MASLRPRKNIQNSPGIEASHRLELSSFPLGGYASNAIWAEAGRPNLQDAEITLTFGLMQQYSEGESRGLPAELERGPHRMHIGFVN